MTNFNLHFLYNIEYGLSEKKCSIFLDLNTYVVKENWVDILEDQINGSTNKLIWASSNSHNSKLPKDVGGYLSNPDIYNFKNEKLSEFFYLLRKLIFDVQTRYPYSSFDLLIKYNETLFKMKKNKVLFKKKFAKLTKENMQSVNGLMNMVNPLKVI